MTTALTAAAPAPSPSACNTGDWAQKFACGWHQPTQTAAHAGTTFGHGAGGFLIAVIVVAVLVAAVRAAGAASRRRTATSS